MIRTLSVLLALVFLASCGVKNDLILPDGKQTAKNRRDPSKPPNPIGE
jgi:predicted small lipoprotein YifL